MQCLNEAPIVNTRVVAAFLQAHPAGSQSYWDGLINDLAFHQTADPLQPITELVSNAIDAVTLANRSNPFVEIRKEGACWIVEDNGTGISLRDIYGRLLLPMATSKQGVSQLIGKFGMGFFSALQYLVSPENEIRLDTSDGTWLSAATIRVFPQDKGQIPFIRVKHAKRQTSRTWTRMTITTDASLDGVSQYLFSKFRYFEAMPIFFDGNRISEGMPEGKMICSEGTILFRALPDAADSVLSIVLNGVQVLSVPYVQASYPSWQKGVELVFKDLSCVTICEDRQHIRPQQNFYAFLQQVLSLEFCEGSLSWEAVYGLVLELVEKVVWEAGGDEETAPFMASFFQQCLSRLQENVLYLPAQTNTDMLDVSQVLEEPNQYTKCGLVHPAIFRRVQKKAWAPFQQNGRPYGLYAFPFKERESSLEKAGQDSMKEKNIILDPCFVMVCECLVMDRRKLPRHAIGSAAEQFRVSIQDIGSLHRRLQH